MLTVPAKNVSSKIQIKTPVRRLPTPLLFFGLRSTASRIFFFWYQREVSWGLSVASVAIAVVTARAVEAVVGVRVALAACPQRLFDERDTDEGTGRRNAFGLVFGFKAWIAMVAIRIGMSCD